MNRYLLPAIFCLAATAWGQQATNVYTRTSTVLGGSRADRPARTTSPAFYPSAFGVNVRLDTNRALYDSRFADIAVWNGPALPVVYAVWERDSGAIPDHGEIVFARSTDAGRTWSHEKLVHRSSNWWLTPSVAVNESGWVYVSYIDSGYPLLMRSTSQGQTWTGPVRMTPRYWPVPIGWTRIACQDSYVYAATNEGAPLWIFLTRSTDGGQTFPMRKNLTATVADNFQPDVCVDPGRPGAVYVSYECTGTAGGGAALKRSLDNGETWVGLAQLDTGLANIGNPRVRALRDTVFCTYDGEAPHGLHQTRCRSSDSLGESFGPEVVIGPRDSIHSSYYNGNDLAVDATGRVHACLMMADTADFDYDIYYASSDDYGSSFSLPVVVNDYKEIGQEDCAIAVDDRGYAYLVWMMTGDPYFSVWFVTNNPAAAVEEAKDVVRLDQRAGATVLGSIGPGLLYDAMGRRVTQPKAGVCFMREPGAADVRKVIIAR
jgi:hypothetical protein